MHPLQWRDQSLLCPIFLLFLFLLLLILLHPSRGRPLSAVYYKQKETKIVEVTYKSKQICIASTKTKVSSLFKLQFIDNNQVTQISGQFQIVRCSMKEIRRMTWWETICREVVWMQVSINFDHQEFWRFSSVQFSSVAESCPTLCDPMNRSMPGLPVHHQLPEFTQTHVHRVGDAI